MVKNGDKVKLRYISDRNKNNNKLGTVINNYFYSYYPDGTIDSKVNRQACTILYDDGSTHEVTNVEFTGSGLISPLEIIE